MNAINSAYPLIDPHASQASVPMPTKLSFWRRALELISLAGAAALTVG